MMNDELMTEEEASRFQAAMEARGWTFDAERGMWLYDVEFADAISDGTARRHWRKWGVAAEPVPF